MTGLGGAGAQRWIVSLALAAGGVARADEPASTDAASSAAPGQTASVTQLPSPADAAPAPVSSAADATSAPAAAPANVSPASPSTDPSSTPDATGVTVAPDAPAPPEGAAVDVPASPVPPTDDVAPAKPRPSFVFSEDFELRWYKSPDSLPAFPDNPRVLDWFEQVNRFTIGGAFKKWTFFTQLDEVALTGTTHFLDDVRVADRELLAPGVWSVLVGGAYDPGTHGLKGWDLFSRNVFINMEKLRAGYTGKNISVELGDSYLAFGRGLSLAVQRNVEIDIDTSIQGVKVQARPGLWDITGFAGQLNRQQVLQDNRNDGLFGDRRHTVGGVRIERYGLGPVNLGAHGVVYNFVTDEGWRSGFTNLKSTPDAVVGGATVEAVGLGPTDWYLEGDGYAYPTADLFGGAAHKPGYALYGSGAVYAGKTTWLIEGKRFYQSEHVNALLSSEGYEVATAPTLEYERGITEDSSAAMNSNNIAGGRVRMDWTAIPGQLVPYWSVAVFRDMEIGGTHFNTVPETIVHPLVGLEWTHNAWSAMANIGYRNDIRDGKDGGSDRQLHGDVLAKVPVKDGWAFDLSLSTEWFQWGNNPVQQHDYVEVESSVALLYKGLFAFTWYTDTSTNPLIDSVGNLSNDVYGAGELQIKPLPNLTLRAFYGAYKSGVRCAGGQCRVLPGFEGARISATATF